MYIPYILARLKVKRWTSEMNDLIHDDREKQSERLVSRRVEQRDDYVQRDR